MTTYVNGWCRCQLNVFRVAFANTSLPITNDCCHCNTCRHTSGQLAVHHAPILGVPLERIRDHGASHIENGSGNIDANGNQKALLAPPSIKITDPEILFDLTGLTMYQTSKPDVTRYFCTSCSAHLFWMHHTPTGDAWAVGVGALERSEGIVKIGYHIWVGDTLDGGLADQLRTIDGVLLPRYKESLGSDELPIGWKAQTIIEAQKPNTDSLDRDQLQAHCHCGAIKFAITRPSEASLAPTSAYPDLLFPYDVSHLSKITNPEDEKWWLCPSKSSNPTKYLAGHCMCSSCRLNSGFEVQSWAYIPLANIIQPHTETPLSLDEEKDRPAGLKQYISSPGKYREFCKTCGASVFWWQAGIPDLMYVSVGLFDEKSGGTRTEGWLEWHKERVGFQEMALSHAVAKGLGDGLKSA